MPNLWGIGLMQPSSVLCVAQLISRDYRVCDPRCPTLVNFKFQMHIVVISVPLHSGLSKVEICSMKFTFVCACGKIEE
jgi:hypothetical protein